MDALIAANAPATITERSATLPLSFFIAVAMMGGLMPKKGENDDNGNRHSEKSKKN